MCGSGVTSVIGGAAVGPVGCDGRRGCRSHHGRARMVTTHGGRARAPTDTHGAASHSTARSGPSERPALPRWRTCNTLSAMTMARMRATGPGPHGDAAGDAAPGVDIAALLVAQSAAFDDAAARRAAGPTA